MKAHTRTSAHASVAMPPYLTRSLTQSLTHARAHACSCHFGGPGEPKPIRMRRGQMVRSVARYNATQHHHGVMALALIDLADVDTMVA